FAIAFFCGIGHWVFTVNGLVEKILGILKAERLNPEDKYHAVFRNIIDEVSVATGGVRIEGVVIPVCAMNAFAISDFSGRNVIGVTEGLLARLSRAQLKTVVDHGPRISSQEIAYPRPLQPRCSRSIIRFGRSSAI
ncbi:MAG TPA: hypothetical protein PLO93_05320, partial [Candidatus Omnitrophota bacterium]|nr:hypothetical protein [Candidatus Omnitrophota bacterium]